eukprot:1281119-Pleurochrysis_carterae.AAC.5
MSKLSVQSPVIRAVAKNLGHALRSRFSQSHSSKTVAWRKASSSGRQHGRSSTCSGNGRMLRYIYGTEHSCSKAIRSGQGESWF